jgi:hypothetical protein
MEWLIIFAIIAICLTVLIYLRSNKEGFVTIDDLIQSNNVFVPQMKFANTTGNYALDTASKGIITNPGVNLSGLNQALAQTDNYLATSKDRDYTSFFEPDPNNAYSEQDKKFCKNVSYPLNLPQRVRNSKVACGWWYHPTEKSVGVLGTVDEPIFRDGLPNGGTYYWNLTEAAMMEDFKLCTAIKECKYIDTADIKGKCGFCDRLGFAVPVDGGGNEKYVNNANALHTCGEEVISNNSQCPQPGVEPPTTSDGVSCGNYGRPSPDNSLRLYTKDECDSHFNGKWFNSGECLIPEGGSYSWECRSLNLPQVLQKQVVTKCTPDQQGNLSRACLIQIALNVGLTKSGSIYRMLNTMNGPSENDKLAMKYLQAAGVTIPQALLGQGNIDEMSAANIYRTLFNTITSGNTEIVRESAKLLAVGSADFDPCIIDTNARGPFELACAQRAFRQAGCQPAGASYPTANSVAALANMTWGEVKNQFATLHTNMNTRNSEEQDTAMNNCLGFKFARLPAPVCQDVGMEHLMYSFNDSEVLYFNNDRYAALIGSIRNDSGFRQINVGGGAVPDSHGRKDRIIMKARAFITMPTSYSGTLDCWTDDGLIMLLDGKTIAQAWYDQPPSYYRVGISIPENKPSMFEINWYENYGGAVLIIQNAIEKINLNMTLPFPKTSPLIAFDFFRGRMEDTHKTVRSANFGVQLQNRGGRQGAFFGDKQYLQILNPIRMKAIKTYTCMVWWDQLPSTDCTLFSLQTENDFLSNRTVRLTAVSNGVYAAYNRNFWYGIGTPFAANKAPIGKWTHYAVTWSELGYGLSVYVDGKQVSTSDNGDLYADLGGSWTQFPDEIMKYIYLGKLSASTGFIGTPDVWRYDSQERNPQMCMGWFHMYDYKLSPVQLEEEIRYWNTAPYERNAIPEFHTNSGVFGALF